MDQFSDEQHRTWAELYRRQVPRIRKHACADYLAGFDMLELPASEIPSVGFLNSKITPATGWKVIRTTVRYSDADQWYEHFDRREFLITDYMRSWDELDWTPEPDMFHDIFGHLPFLMLPHYTALQELFAPAYWRATTEEERENIKRLAWFSTEFGVISENGSRKIFGTGLMSGGDEMDNVMAGNVPIHPFTIENVLVRNKAVDEQNKELFEFLSIEELEKELSRYFDLVMSGGGVF
ncbi:MAG: hypothetical protein ACE5MI_05435 [Acidimicrobiia bacterium]